MKQRKTLIMSYMGKQVMIRPSVRYLEKKVLELLRQVNPKMYRKNLPVRMADQAPRSWEGLEPGNLILLVKDRPLAVKLEIRQTSKELRKEWNAAKKRLRQRQKELARMEAKLRRSPTPVKAASIGKL